MSFVGDLVQIGKIDTASKNGGNVQFTNPFHWADAQVIDMLDDTVVLQLNGVEVTAAPITVTMTSNVLAVDATSSGTEKLKLPPEGDCNGFMVTVLNTGGESILVRSDSDGAIKTVATTEIGIFVCDGTTWRGFNI